MKRLVLALLLLTPLTLTAADKPNPADFTIKVHVIASRAGQVLEATIDGEPLELRTSSDGVLALGDYPARVSKKIHALNTRDANTYDIYRGYDLLMPDGKIRTYTLTRLGPAVPHS